MRNLPVWFDGLSPDQLKIHLQYLADVLQSNARIHIELGGGATIPVRRREYRTRPLHLVLLVRVSDVGRKPLLEIRDNLAGQSFKLHQRRSVKRGLLGQVAVDVSVDDSDFTERALRALESINSTIGGPSPARFAVGYEDNGVDRSLPGKFSLQTVTAGWPYRLGQRLGRFFGWASRGPE